MYSAFVNRDSERRFLEEQYASPEAAFVVIYGRRRVGKTRLIQEFIRDKSALYFLASAEIERANIARFGSLAAELTGFPFFQGLQFDNWDQVFRLLLPGIKDDRRMVVIIDEFQYLVRINPAFPSILQRLWDEWLGQTNVMLIICGSLVSMMESNVLAHSSPLYGRRTGQIKLKQLEFIHYQEFFKNKPIDERIQYYAVTGGVPRYIELFKPYDHVFQAIEKNILPKQSYLYEEPVFLLDQEVGELGSYFSILKAIALGNHKLGHIASFMGLPTSALTRYIQNLIDLDLLERQIPVTEKNPARSKRGLYFIKDNFIEFWFKFIFPYRDLLELENKELVIAQIKARFIDSHVAFVFEGVCRQILGELNRRNVLPFNLTRVGRWWEKELEIDLVGINEEDGIIFGECKYLNHPVDVDVLNDLMNKSRQVVWGSSQRQEAFIIFSRSGFTKHLHDLAKDNPHLLLYDLEQLALLGF